MKEHSETIPIPDPTLPGHVPVRLPATAELVASPHVPDDLLNATEGRP